MATSDYYKITVRKNISSQPFDIDCITKNFMDKEKIKTNIAILRGTYSDICTNINIRKDSDELAANALWIATADGSIDNPDGVKLLYSKNDILYTILNVESLEFTTVKAGNIFNSSRMYVVIEGNTMTFYYDASDRKTESNIVYPFDGSATWASDSAINTIDKVVFDESFKNARPSRTINWFSNFIALDTIENIQYLNTSAVIDMSNMFNNCAIENVNLSNLNTSRVKTMKNMFTGSGITSVDMSNWDTSKVTDMSYMFSGSKIGDAHLLNTSSVTTMAHMFDGCSANIINISGFDTSKVTDFSYMFSSSAIVNIVGVNDIDTSAAENMTAMFMNYSGTELDISNLVTSNVTTMDYMFSTALNLSTIDISNFDTSKVTDFSYMFSGDTDLSCIYSLNLDSWTGDTTKTVNSSKMFESCTSLPHFPQGTTPTEAQLDVRNANASDTGYFTEYPLYAVKTEVNVEDEGEQILLGYSLVFYADRYPDRHTEGIVYLDISRQKNWPRADDDLEDYIYVEFTNRFARACPRSCKDWFKGMKNLVRIINPLNLNTAHCTSMESMFEECVLLKTVDVTKFNLSKVESMKNMFKGAETLLDVNLNGVNTSNLKYMDHMFDGAYKLSTIDMGGMDVSKVESFNSLFYECVSLQTLITTKVVQEKRTDTDGKEYYINVTRRLNTGNVTDMTNMFWSCGSLISVDLSGWDVTKVKYMSNMFSACDRMATIDLRDWVTSSVEDLSYMFLNCRNTKIIYLNNFNVSHVTKFDYMFYSCTYLEHIVSNCRGSSNHWSGAAGATCAGMFGRCSVRLPYYEKSNVDISYTYVGYGGYFSRFIPKAIKIKDTISNEWYLRFYCDWLDHDRDGGTIYEFAYNNNGTPYIGWTADTDVKYVEFDSSFESYLPLSTKDWFNGFTNLVKVYNTRYVIMKECTDTSFMFNGCSSLTAMNVSTWEPYEVTTMESMFNGCQELVYICTSSKRKPWNQSTKILNSSDMFTGCLKLKGAVEYSADNVTVSMANLSGYFTTLKFDVVKYRIPDSGGSCKLVFYYDGDDHDLDANRVATYSMRDGSTAKAWPESDTDIVEVVFDNSLRNLEQGLLVNSLSRWFYGYSNLTTLTNLSNLAATSTLNDASYMFYKCIKLESVPQFDSSISGKALNCSHMFDGCSKLLSNTRLVASNATYMFNECSKLQSISNLTVYGTDASYMCYGCEKLETIYECNLSSVNTADYMFYGCSNYNEPVLSETYTKNIINMPNICSASHMFHGCISLGSIDTTVLGLTNCTSTESMFENCYTLEFINFKHVRLDNVTNMDRMFYDCDALGHVVVYDDADGWGKPQCTSDGMFFNCEKLHNFIAMGRVTDRTHANASDTGYFELSLPIYVKTPNIPDVRTYTLTCYFDEKKHNDTPGSISSYDLPVRDSTITKVIFDETYKDYTHKTFESMFAGYSALVEVDNLSLLNTSASTSTAYMFDGCGSLTTFATSDKEKKYLGSWFDTSKIKDFTYMFNGCTWLGSSPGLNVSSAEKLTGLYCGCEHITYLNLNSWDTKNVTDMSYLFAGCTRLQTVVTTQATDAANAKTWNVSKVTSFDRMFYGCSKINHIYSTNTVAWTGATLPDGTSATSSEMFTGCVSIAGGNIYSPNKVSKSETTIFSYFSPDSFTAVWIRNAKSTDTSPRYTVRFYYDKYNHSDEAGQNGHVNAAKFDKYSVTFSEGAFSKDKITDIEIDSSMVNFVPDSGHPFGSMFAGCSNLTSIKNFKYLNISSGPINSFFEGCSSLETFDFEGNDIHSDEANYLFRNCTKLKSIDLKTATFSGCAKLNSMFENCTSLESIDMSNVNINCTHFNDAFKNCTSLKTVNINGVSRAKEARNLFYGCSLLKSLSALRLNSVDDASYMFYQCYSLPDVKFPTLYTLKNASAMFYDCISLETVYIPQLDGSSLENVSGLFYNCISLKVFTFSPKFCISHKLSYIAGMFYNCMELTNIVDTTNWETDNITDMSYLFFNCKKLTGVNVENWNMKSVKDISYMFYNCEKLQVIDTSKWKAPNLNDMQYAFFQCKRVTTIDLSKLETNNVRSLHHTFDGCIAATSINANGITTSNVSTMSYAFYGCSALKTVGTATWNAYRLLDASHLFDGCSALKEIQIAAFVPIITVSLDYMFNGCSSLEHIYAFMHTPWIGNNATSENMFGGCTKLHNFTAKGGVTDKTYATSDDGYFDGMGFTVVKHPLGDGTYSFRFYFDFDRHEEEGTVQVFDTAKTWDDGDTSIVQVEFCESFKNARAEKCVNWFKGMSNLKRIINSSNMNFCEVYNMSGMFDGCSSLKFVDGSTWDIGNVDDASNAFNGCSSLAVMYLNIAKSTSMVNSNYMFNGCNKLQYIYCPNTWSSLYTSTNMFLDCSMLDNYNVNNVQDIRQARPSAYFTYITDEEEKETKTTKAYLSGQKLVFVCNKDIMPDAWYMSRKCSKPWTSSDIRNITTVEVVDEITIYSTKEWFSGCTSLSTLSSLNKIKTQYITDMSSMFNGCTALVDADIPWTFDNLENIASMFSGCRALISVGLSKWNTNNLKHCENMFNGCSALTTIEATNTTPWTVSDTNSANMFAGCSKLPNWNKSNPPVTNATRAKIGFPFGDGYFTLSGTEIPKLARTGNTATFYYDTNYHRDADEVFYFTNSYTWDSMNKSAVTTVVFTSNFESFKPTTLAHWFDGFENLTSISDMKYLTTDDVTDMSYMFNGCHSIKNLNLNKLSDTKLFKTDNVGNMRNMFNECRALENLDIAGFVTTNVTDMQYMFSECKALKNINIASFTTAAVTSMSHMFNECNAASSLAMSGFNTEAVKYMDYMFTNVNQAISIDVSSFNTSIVENMEHMFDGCENVGVLIVSDFNTTNVTKMNHMFNKCKTITSLDVSEFNTAAVTDMQYMFSECKAVQVLDVDEFNTAAVNNMNHMFNMCEAVSELNLTGFNTLLVTDMSYMFNGCKQIEELDVGSFSITKVTSFDYMFAACVGLEKIYSNNNGALNAWNGNNATSTDMFQGDTKLPNYGTGENVTKAKAYIDTYPREGGFFSRATAWAIKIANTEPAGTYTLKFCCDRDNHEAEGVPYEITYDDPCPWSNKGNLDQIIKVEFLPNFSGALVASTSHWFDGFSILKEIIGIEYVDASQITDMSYMFRNCYVLETVNIIGWNTQSLQNASYMFQNCYELEGVDIMDWNTTNLNNTTCMFDGCSYLAAIYASS